MNQSVIESQWSYGDKGNTCSKSKVHLPDCDGDCERITLPNSVIDLHNELVKWTTDKLPLQGVPESLAAVPFVVGNGQILQIPGIHINILTLEIQLQSLLTFLKEKDLIDAEEFDEHYRVYYFNKIKSIREAMGQQNIAVKPEILVPHLREIKH